MTIPLGQVCVGALERGIIRCAVKLLGLTLSTSQTTEILKFTAVITWNSYLPLVIMILRVHAPIFASYTKMGEYILWVCESHLSVFTHFSAIVVTFHDWFWWNGEMMWLAHWLPPVPWCCVDRCGSQATLPFLVWSLLLQHCNSSLK